MKPQFDYPWVYKNFQPKEVTCKCKCGLMPTKDAMDAIQTLRDFSMRPIKINSGARCRKHNKAVGGARNSWHIKGMAFDLRVNRKTATTFVSLANQLEEFNGFGYSLKRFWGFIHLDIRPVEKEATWTY